MQTGFAMQEEFSSAWAGKNTVRQNIQAGVQETE
jgi:hypothetical protein